MEEVDYRNTHGLKIQIENRSLALYKKKLSKASFKHDSLKKVNNVTDHTVSIAERLLTLIFQTLNSDLR